MASTATERQTSTAASSGAAGPAPSFFARHDLVVVLAAVVVMGGAYAAYAGMKKTQRATFSQKGLSFEYPRTDMLAVMEPDWNELPAEVTYGWLGAGNRRLTVRVEERLQLGEGGGDLGTVTYLQSRRKKAYDPFYSEKPTDVAKVNGREWLRTEYRHAAMMGEPVVQEAIEYALLNGEKLYIVTVHADHGVKEMESSILGTLAVK